MGFDRIVLDGEFVRLEPLTREHLSGLCDAIRDGALWNLNLTLVPHPNNIAQFFDFAETSFCHGDGIAYAIIDKQTDKIAGSTRFMKANLAYKRVEIGYTFLGQSWQRTRTNTEAKFLMLSHAFEQMRMNRVELLTDYLNNTSRQAILRLGAKEEGILRSHMVMPDGRVRDSVIYSIIQHEWPGIKQHLAFLLNR
ncbi:GNAT family N-acetyltransferase [Cellvibrio sp. ARAG 10.3]|uniref:GNAT family N-acetyltransferase n=1 Tax=Cellvibrio sp. ARAG 10.3 TaxID=3451358 RepID=UPI003F44619F